LPAIFIIIAGVLGGFLASSALLVLILMFLQKNVLDFLLVLLIFGFFLADNFTGPFAFMQNFRFVIVFVSFLYMLKNNVFKNNNANYLLPFTIVAFCITLLFSPIGITAVLRSLGFWVVGLVIFKIVNLLYSKNSKRASELLVITSVTFVFYNIVLWFSSFEFLYLAGRYKGLAGNPNGLALVLMFNYALLLLVKKRKDITFTKHFFLVIRILIFLLIILTGSRTAMFSVITFQFLIWANKRKALGFISIVILSLLYLFIEEINLSFLAEISFLRIETLADAGGRTEVWPVAWEEISNAPFFGNGILYDSYFIKDYVNINIGDNALRHWGGVWNSYLSLLLDVGIIGFIAYVYFWIQAFRKSHYKNIAIAFTTMCFLSGFTESWMAASMNAFTPMMFLFWAIQSQPATNK
jgi:O-antigen ligase